MAPLVPKKKKTWLHLVSSSFERWTFSIDLQCVFQSGSRRIQILCNFISLVPSVQHIKVSNNDTAWEGALQDGRLSCCVFSSCIFSQKVLCKVCKVSSSKSFVTGPPNKYLFEFNMVFVKFSWAATLKMKEIMILLLLQFWFWCIHHFYKCNWIWNSFLFHAESITPIVSNWTHKDTVSDELILLRTKSTDPLDRLD